jgi:hypothetical protein
MEIICADCGCIVDRGAIVTPYAAHPNCCFADLPGRNQEASE